MPIMSCVEANGKGSTEARLESKRVQGALPRVCRALILLSAIASSGCVGPLVPVVRIDAATALQLHEKVKIYERAELKDEMYTRLGPIQATSCQNKTWEMASEQNAIDQLLYKSARLGGNGVTIMNCATEGTSFSKNCWSSVTCYGTALKISRASGRASARRGPSSGTGFVISTQGHILTNSHVVNGANVISVYLHGERHPATLVREDLQNDLAVLKIERVTTPLNFRDDSRVRAGEGVAAMGFPLSGILSREPHVTTGSVTALAGIQDDVRFLQISAPLQPGNSGGPVLDESGRVIGIAVSQLDALKLALATGDIPQNVNFAIKSSIAKTFLDAVGIGFTISSDAAKQSVAEFADGARGSVVLVERD